MTINNTGVLQKVNTPVVCAANTFVLMSPSPPNYTEKHMNLTYGQRLKAARTHKKLTQPQLAEISGVPQGTISKIERGDQETSAYDSVLAHHLDVNALWLRNGDELLKPEWLGGNYKTPKLTVIRNISEPVKSEFDIQSLQPAELRIPLLSWVRAGDFCEAPGQFGQYDAEEWLPAPLFNTGPNTFALTVRGDSMDGPDGYKEGEIVYIDPDITPTIGDDVLASTDTGITLKRYKEDEAGAYLLALNGNRIIHPTAPWHICGVVVFSGKRRR